MYGFTTTLIGLSFDAAIEKTTAALKAEGFGILIARGPDRSGSARCPSRVTRHCCLVRSALVVSAH